MAKTAYNITLKGYVGGADFDRTTVDRELAKNNGKQVNEFINTLDVHSILILINLLDIADVDGEGREGFSILDDGRG